MKRTWKLTDVEFFALWDELNEGVVPAPFFFSTDTESGIAFEREVFEARQELRSRHDFDMREVLTAIADPDLRIVISGADSDEPMKPTGLVRILAVRRGDRGYIVTQLPGRTYWHSGGYVITECDPLRLADAAVDALPEYEAGRSGEIVLSTRDSGGEMDYSYGRSSVRDSFADTEPDRARLFLERAAKRTGTIEVVQGRSRFGPRGVTRYRLEWRDLADDGRYVIDDRNPPVAIPVDSRQLVAVTNARVAAVIRAIKDERV